MMDMSSDLTSTTYLQLDPMHQVVPSSDLKMGIVNPDAGHQLTTIAPVPVPEPFIDSSCFAVIDIHLTQSAVFQSFLSSLSCDDSTFLTLE